MTEPIAAEPAAAQFQLYRTAADSPVRWRLLSGNHRPIGRSVLAYETVADCERSVIELVSLIGELTAISCRVPGNQWIWRLSHDEVDLAVSAHAYDRQIRAIHAQAHFRHRAELARINSAVMVTAARRWRSLAGAGSREPIR